MSLAALGSYLAAILGGGSVVKLAQVIARHLRERAALAAKAADADVTGRIETQRLDHDAERIARDELWRELGHVRGELGAVRAELKALHQELTDERIARARLAASHELVTQQLRERTVERDEARAERDELRGQLREAQGRLSGVVTKLASER